MTKERVDVRVESEFLEELDAIAEREGLSRSELIREAVMDYVLDNRETWNSRLLKVSIPNRMADKVQMHIHNGDAKTPEDAVLLALDFWLRDLEHYYLNRRKRMERTVKENARSDNVMKQLEEKGKELGRR